MTQPVLALLHSPLTSAAAWGELPGVLADRGYRAVVPEVLDDDAPPYAQRYVARAALQLGADAPGNPLILVGHSGAGPLLPQIGFARHAAGVPVSGYVFLDAMLPRTLGTTNRLDLFALEDPAFADDFTRSMHEGARFPNWSESDLAEELPDPAHRAVLLAGLRPRSLDFFVEPLPLAEDWPDARCGYLQLSAPYGPAAATAERRGWTVERIASHHFAAMNEPDMIGDALVDLVERM